MNDLLVYFDTTIAMQLERDIAPSERQLVDHCAVGLDLRSVADVDG